MEVNQQAVVSEKVSTKDGLLHIRDNENPGQRASQTEVESKGATAVGGMEVLLTAVSVRGSGVRRRSEKEGGTTLTSEPVSTRKEVLVCASHT